MLGECCGQDQPIVGDEVVIVEDHCDGVETARRSLLKGALLKSGIGWCRNPNSRCSAGAFRERATHQPQPSRWIQAADAPAATVQATVATLTRSRASELNRSPVATRLASPKPVHATA